MKRLKTLFVVALGVSTLIACNSVVPPVEDGTGLWFTVSGKEDITLDTPLSGIEEIIDPRLGAEEFRIFDSLDARYIASGSRRGIMYGAYALQRAKTLGEADGKGLDIHESPAYELRMLDHWDNLDDTVERGYAGHSMWEWTSDTLPVERIRQYGSLCASVGINAATLNNVNSNPAMLDSEHIERVKQIADLLRPYGIATYIAIKWTSPIALDGLKSGDPLDPQVRKWWKGKVAEIYKVIPDFGGFLVKANSEGQAGPQDYGRTHADGANMLAEALAPYGGRVMWRAFVYSPTSPDRASQAVEEFKPLDGQFADNVLVQIKNGPVDFQPREPFNPLFGQLRKTNMMMEFQITQEYLGFSNHLVYHGTTYKECLDSDTYRDGEGSTVAKVIKGIAGVANTGQDPNFCGYIFAQANWYMFGRLSWNPGLSPEGIAHEWILQTFKRPQGVSADKFEKKFVKPVLDIMMTSRETAVNYSMPMGLHHIFAGSHYGPGPWERSVRPDWSPYYYHKADSLGIGFDRTASGSNNIAQYNEPLASKFSSLQTSPENLILWFHHVPWDYKMSSGRSVWDELCLHYDRGISEVEDWQKTWAELKDYVSSEIFAEVERKMQIQHNDAEWWRDACIGYFQTFSHRDLPSEVRPIRIPIDSLIGHSVLSDRDGMPTHGEDLRPVIVPNRRPPFRKAPLPEGMSSH